MHLHTHLGRILIHTYMYTINVGNKLKEGDWGSGGGGGGSQKKKFFSLF